MTSMPKGYDSEQAFCGFLPQLYSNVVMAQHNPSLGLYALQSLSLREMK
jgi:hypothetical protein